MTSPELTLGARRWLIKRLLALPALAAAPQLACAESAPAANPLAGVLNIMDFEALARAALPPAHFGYIASGVDDDRTVVRNQEAFGRVEIRSRRFVDVSRLDTSVELLGTRLPVPVYLCPVASQRGFHADGEIGTARAAASRSTLMMLSTASSASLEDVSRARGTPVWMQIYPTDDWNVTKALVKRAERAGCPAIVLTVDTMGGGRNSETFLRAARKDDRVCSSCHINNNHDFVRKAPIFAGIDVSRVKAGLPMNLTWDFLDRFRELVSVKLLVKGIVIGEDAALCVTRGVDGVIVSNHGGRNEETLRASFQCLPEISAAVAGRVPVLLDGGVRRGTDIFKALALGATAVGIGRPQVWGLAAAGQQGVEAVLDIYKRELEGIMRQAGTPNVAAIARERVVVTF